MPDTTADRPVAPGVDSLVSYVPPAVARLYEQRSDPLTAPRADRGPAAALFADITGFTALTERLAGQGPQGVEQLSHLLNEYFGRLVDEVNAHGGEVVKFAGDGLLAVWRADVEDLRTVTHRAAQCGLAVQTRFRGYETGSGEPLELTIAIGAGEMVAAHVGGVEGRWEFLTTGDPMVQVGVAEEHASPGTVVLAPPAWALVEADCGGQPLPNGAVRLYELREPLPLRAADPPPRSPQAEAALRGYLPAAILARVAAGHSGWLAELRRLTVLFLNVAGLDGTGPDPLAPLQRSMETIQRVLGRYEGTINKLMVDATGTACVAAFGLPPLAHEDDPSRAVHAALDLRTALHDLGFTCAMGIASGQAFCGPVGGERRREYTMIGDVVNLAARFMQAAGDDVWCDAATHQATRNQFAYDALPHFAVKGKVDAVPVYRPARAAGGTRARRVSAAGTGPLVGRRTELEAIRARLDAVQARRGGVLTIEGEAGIGKSRLVDELVRQARDAGATCLEGAADAVEQTTPYHAWRPIFTNLLNGDGAADGTVPAARLDQRLADAGAELQGLAPLLNSVLPLGLADNDLTEHMTGQLRAENTHLVLAGLLRAHAQVVRLVIVLEDAHWMDSASWALAVHVHRTLPEVLVVLVTRPYTDHTPGEFTQLVGGRDAHRLPLEPLPVRDTLQLVCARLSVRGLPAEVERLIDERAQGNPFFSEELAYALRDAGYLRIANGACTLAPEAENLRELALPDTVQGVVTSRIDRLTPTQQLALKAASVIGRVFAFRVLRDIYPVESDRSLLHEYLEALHTLDLTPIETPEPDLTYIFKHIITQEVAYNLMLQAQRQQLHRAAAEWYERTYAQELSPYYALLAHHWRNADAHAQALTYCARAGEQALQKGAFQEAVHFFTQALDMDSAEGEATGGTKVQRAKWERYLAEAYLTLGQLGEALAHTTRAMRLLGTPLPERPVGRLAMLASQVLRQAGHRLRRRPHPARTPEARERAQEVARNCALNTEMHYFRGDILPFLVSTVVGVNGADRSGDPRERLRTYAGSCMVLGALRLHRAVEHYSRLADAVADQVADPIARGYANMARSVYYLGHADWDRTHACLDRCLEAFTQLGHARYWGNSLSVRTLAHLMQGAYPLAHDSTEALIAVARQLAGDENYARALIHHGHRLYCIGADWDESARFLTDGADRLGSEGDRVHLVRARGLLALIHLRQGQPYQAMAAADAALALVPRSTPSPTIAFGLGAIAQVYLGLWEAGDTAAGPKARAVCSTMHKTVGKFRAAQAETYLCSGWARWLAGKHAAARRHWERARVAADTAQMPRERAAAHRMLGRHLPHEDAARRGHLEEACAIFERIGAQDDLARARAELDAGS